MLRIDFTVIYSAIIWVNRIAIRLFIHEELYIPVILLDGSIIYWVIYLYHFLDINTKKNLLLKILILIDFVQFHYSVFSS